MIAHQLLIENYHLAMQELATRDLHESVHWRRLNEGFEARLTDEGSFRQFRRNRLSHGFDDANPFTGLKPLADFERTVRTRALALAQALDPDGLLQLAESPVGEPPTVDVDGVPVSITSLDFAYFAWNLSSIIDVLPAPPRVVVEIGGGFGGLARLLRARYPTASFVLYDLPPQLVLSAYFLSAHFPTARFCLFRDLDARFEPTAWDFALLPGWRMATLAPSSVDLVINTRSMMEMRPKVVAEYFQYIQRVVRPGGLFYCVNRYRKQIGNEVVCLADYPFDDRWTVLFSKSKWGQEHVHELMLQRRADTNPEYPYPELAEIRRRAESFPSTIA